MNLMKVVTIISIPRVYKATPRVPIKINFNNNNKIKIINFNNNNNNIKKITFRANNYIKIITTQISMKLTINNLFKVKLTTCTQRN